MKNKAAMKSMIVPTIVQGNLYLVLILVQLLALAPADTMAQKMRSRNLKGGLTVLNDSVPLYEAEYQWVGTRWSGFAKLAAPNETDIKVAGAADFPASHNGIIKLQRNAVYAVKGTVTLGDKIDLNGATLKGLNNTTDRLIYTAQEGEMFTGSNGGVIYNLGLSAPESHTALFNLDGKGRPEKNLVLEACDVNHCSHVGQVAGFGGFVIFSGIHFSYNDNGIVLEDLGDFAGHDEVWEANNAHTFQKFVGTFNTISKKGGKMNPSSEKSATAIDISEITTIRQAAGIKSTSFNGNGTMVKGNFTGKWDIASSGLGIERDEAASGALTLASGSSTQFPDAGVPVKIEGKTTTLDAYKFKTEVANRFTYTGYLARKFQVSYTITPSDELVKGSYTFYVAHNGVPVAGTKKKVTFTAVKPRVPVTDSQYIVMAAGDYIEIWVSNDNDKTFLNLKAMQVSVD